MHDAGDERLKILWRSCWRSCALNGTHGVCNLNRFHVMEGREEEGVRERVRVQSSEVRVQQGSDALFPIEFLWPKVAIDFARCLYIGHVQNRALASTMLSSLLLHTFPNMLPGPLSQENTSASGRNATSKHSSLPTAPRRISQYPRIGAVARAIHRHDPLTP